MTMQHMKQVISRNLEKKKKIGEVKFLVIKGECQFAKIFLLQFLHPFLIVFKTFLISIKIHVMVSKTSCLSSMFCRIKFFKPKYVRDAYLQQKVNMVHRKTIKNKVTSKIISK